MKRLLRMSMQLGMLLSTLIMFAVAASPAFANVDLVSPENNALTGDTTINFEYKLDYPEATGCTLNLNSVDLPAASINQGFNTIVVDNLNEGSYGWHINCDGGLGTQTSSQRSFFLDLSAPTVTILAPNEPATQLQLALLVTDKHSTMMECAVLIDGDLIDDPTIENGTTFTSSYAVAVGNHTLAISCEDDVNNVGSSSRDIEILPEDRLNITMDKTSYGLGEPARLTINAPPDANVSVDICPDGQGFVQCISPLVDEVFPQTILLPYLNQSGNYTVDGFATTPRGVIVNSTNFTIENTMIVTLEMSGSARQGDPLWLEANAYGGIGEITYTWHLSNNSVIDTTNERMEVLYRTPGNYEERIVATDEAGNFKETTLWVIVEEIYPVTLTVVNNRTGSPLDNVTIDVVGDPQDYVTNSAGKVIVNLEKGTNKLYLTRPGYDYTFQKVTIDDTTKNVVLSMVPETETLEIVLKKPADAVQFTTADTVEITFAVIGAEAADCSLMLGEGSESFLEEMSSLNIQDTAVKGFTIGELTPTTYTYVVECEQYGKRYTSQTRRFTVVDAETSGPEVQVSDPVIAIPESFDNYKNLFTEALENIALLGPDEQDVATLLGIKSALREAKRVAGTNGRDVFDLRYRNDLTQGEIDAETKKKEQEVDGFVQRVPVGIKVLDKKAVSNYITEEEIDSFVEENMDFLTKYVGDIPEKSLKKYLHEAQQKYTLSTKLYHVELTYADQRTELVSVVAKQLRYGKQQETEGGADDVLLEILPEAIKEKEYTFIQESQVFLDGALVVTGAVGDQVYSVNGEVAFSELESAKTMFVPAPDPDMAVVTGYSIFGLDFLDGLAKKLGVSLAVLIAILIASYLVYYFNLVDQVRFLFYEAGPKPKTHFIQVLINDAKDHIRQGALDQAMLIYKEIKLSYDALPVPAKNELFTEISDLCARLDKLFMQQEIVRMDHALKQDHLEEAIEHFAKVEGAYSRLPSEEQEKVSEIVQGLAKRIGVAGVGA